MSRPKKEDHPEFAALIDAVEETFPQFNKKVCRGIAAAYTHLHYRPMCGYAGGDRGVLNQLDEFFAAYPDVLILQKKPAGKILELTSGRARSSGPLK